jgi:16S rRNA (uracil1498-N3)-methyltransferase
MIRRLHVPILSRDIIRLDDRQSHHARDVLRLALGGRVELFDDAGRSAEGVIVSLAETVEVRVEAVRQAEAGGLELTVAAAVPKGNRADWMVEKLSELGVARFVPLAAERSVARPEGKGKAERWRRLAEESAKQCRRTGVMRIEGLTELSECLAGYEGVGWYCSTGPGAVGMSEAAGRWIAGEKRLVLLVGPEGGWTEAEERLMSGRGLTAVSLGVTILRTETAAIAAVAGVRALLGAAAEPEGPG